MTTKIYRAGDRGYVNHDWLQANYSFSFANYYNPSKVNFGALRVLNDDVIQGGTGFGEHPHENMEIITIPLEGSLKHKDSMSNEWIALKTGEVQVMSAGSGIVHAERNNSSNEFINLFQIWIIPDKMNVEPAYAQKAFEPGDRINKLQTLVSSYADADEKGLKIHQDAKISRVDIQKGMTLSYDLKTERHGVYMMVISGEIETGEFALEKRDAIGIWDAGSFSVSGVEDAELLFIEVPMAL